MNQLSASIFKNFKFSLSYIVLQGVSQKYKSCLSLYNFRNSHCKPKCKFQVSYELNDTGIVQNSYDTMMRVNENEPPTRVQQSNIIEIFFFKSPTFRRMMLTFCKNHICCPVSELQMIIQEMHLFINHETLRLHISTLLDLLHSYQHPLVL